MINRYSRQILFSGIGAAGQRKLGSSFAVVIGCGALGTVAAEGLVRGGVGRVRIVDRDLVEYHNLQRQVLFDEDDARQELPKAVAVQRHLRNVNSMVNIEGVVADVNFANVESLVRGADVIVDGLDNAETRFVVNDAALKLDIPWVYGGAIAASGMTMNIIPGETPCFRCLSDGPGGKGIGLTCDTAGVISPAPWIIGSLQVAEAVKILVGAPEISRQLVVIDVWRGSFQHLNIERREGCPACGGKYEFLDAKSGARATVLCGQDAVQVYNAATGGVALADLAERLRNVGEVTHNEFLLHFTADSNEMYVFPDGRAIVKNTTDESKARSFYSKYIGT